MNRLGCPDLRIERGGTRWMLALTAVRSSRTAVTYGILVCVMAVAAVVAVGFLYDLLPSPFSQVW
jgi:hypothetical protein